MGIDVPQPRQQQHVDRSKLETIASRLGSACKLWVAWKDGEAIGANLVLQGINAHATRGAIDPDRGRPLRAGYLLDWQAIRDAAESGCHSYHLGETARRPASPEPLTP